MDTVALLHSCFLFSALSRALDHIPNAFALAQACHRTDPHLTWQQSVGDRRHERERSGISEAKHTIAAAAALAAAAKETASRHGHPADFAVFQQQLRQEITDVIQQLRTEMNETVNGRMDMLNSINTAHQNVSTETTDFKLYRISDFIQRNWEGSNEKGEFRSVMSHFHLLMQAWSGQGERILARVESVDKVDRATLAVDCTEADFRTFETALYQVLHRTTANEPLKMIQQVEGQRGFEAWHLIVRRYDQRNTSDRSSAYAALISNITERGRAKDVEQFDDILRTFTNEMTKFENRFGKIRDEEKVFAVKKLMSESLQNYRFRGTAMPYGELIIALENIIIDKVSTVPAARSRKHDTSAPM